MTSRRDVIDQLGPTAAAAGAVMLTSLALAPTLGEGPWIAATLSVILTVAVVGLGLRSLAWPGWLVTLGQGVVLVLVITWIYASDVARLGVLPDTAVWSVFNSLADEGANVINDEVAPVTVTTGVQFLVVIGVAAIAWVVDAIAVTWRQATMAGVPLLALYLVPAIVLPEGVPWPLFLLAGAGWLLLLLTDGRRELLRWGRPMDSNSSGRLHSVGGTGRRLGAAALTIAVIVPVVLPSLDDGRFGLGQGDEGGDNGNGSSDDDDSDPSALPILTVNPIADLRRDLTRGDDSPAFGYATAAEEPEYFRLATLDSFSGTTWTLEELGADSDQQASDGLPEPPGLEDSTEQSSAEYTVIVEELESPRLPLPYPVARVAIDGDWRYDLDTFDVFSAEEGVSSLDQEFTATHRVISPTVEQLRTAGDPDPAAVDSTMTDLPDETEELLDDLTLRIARRADNDYDRALLIQNWFRTEFAYSLDAVEGNSTEALQDFLDDRSGYCEQFAATMALMARVLDIPSRVAVGFTPGEELEDDLWAVTAHDAHAWPELWFQTVGWVRFEPTPGGGDGSGTPAYAPAPASEPQSGGGGSGNGDEPKLRRQPTEPGPGGRETLEQLREINRSGQGLTDGGVSGGSSDGSGGSRVWLWLTLIVIAVGVAAAPTTASFVRRRHRWRIIENSHQAVEAAWADVLDAAADVDLRAQATETPRDVAARLPRSGGLTAAGAADLRALARWVEQLRYGGTSVQLPDAEEIRARSARIRSELFESLSSADRRKVKWWPASGRLAVIDSWNSLSTAEAETSQRWSSRIGGLFRRRRRGVGPSVPQSGS